MALQSSDLLLVGRGGVSYYTTAEEFATYIQGSDALTYRGTVDLTAAIGAQLNPAVPVVGDVYLSSTQGTINAEWSITPQTTTEVGDRVFFNGSNWELIQSGSQDVGVTDISVTAPLADNGTPSQPALSVTDATNAAKGVVTLAEDAYDGDGKIQTDSMNDVLTGTHFDVLQGRITTAAGGGLQTIVGTDPIESSVNGGGDTATVSIKDGTIAQKGAVTLDNTVAENVETTAATPKAVYDYAVPLNISSLPNLSTAP